MAFVRSRRFGAGMAVAMCGFALAVLVAVPAGAASRAGSPSISVSPASVPAGGTVTFSGTFAISADCGADDARLVSEDQIFPPDGVTGLHVHRDASGHFAIVHTVPATARPDTYAIGMRCGGGNVGVSATLRVTAQVSSTPTGAPPAGLGGASGGGGSSPLPWALAGALLVVGGLAGLMVWRRRAAT